MEQLEGIAAADAHLGRRVPLPRAALPLARWVEVLAHPGGAVEVAWNLDDTRDGTPGRLALYACPAPPPEREIDGLGPFEDLGALRHRTAPLDQAQPSLRPVHELHWQRDGLHLRLTAQGPWTVDDLRSIAESVG